MRDIAWATIKDRKAGFAGAFVAVMVASTLIAALGVLLESTLRGGIPPERYAGATVVVGAQQALPVADDIDVHLGERARVPSETVGAVDAVPGVARAVGDVSVPVTTWTGAEPIDTAGESTTWGHGWSSAVLTPFRLVAGAEPSGAREVVLDEELAVTAGVGVGDSVEVAVGAVPASYTVAGIASPERDDLLRRSAVFFSDQRVRELTRHPDEVDAVGVIGERGVSADELADRIEAAFPDREIRTYTGGRRADVEFLDVAAARSELGMITSSLGGTAIMIAMFVVASTLALSIHQRRREFAVLRAIGASPRQIRRMVRVEVTLVAGLAAVLGALPAFGVAQLLKQGFAAGGTIPDEFDLALSPLPALAAIVLCVATARIAGRISARKPAKIKPVEALGEAAMEPATLSPVRIVIGYGLVVLGLASSLLPLFVPGTAAVAGAASSAVLLAIAVAVLGPRLMRQATSLLAGPLGRASTVAGYLAAANTRANSRRLAAAVTPLVLAIAFVSVQLFSQTTVAAAAHRQVGDGVVADFVVSSSGPGVADEVVDAVGRLDGIATATPVIRSQVHVRYEELGEPTRERFSAGGITSAGLERTLDLEVRHGTMAKLAPGTVALSQFAADTFGTDIGETIDLTLGDGTSIRPSVVATYDRGLGFGDITVPHDVLAEHTTTGLSDSILVGIAEDASADTVDRSLRDLARDHPGLVVTDNDGLAAAGQAERDEESWVSILGLIVILLYLVVAVVNTLVMATLERAPEFALLRRIGTSTPQIARMMRAEALIIVLIAAVVGTLVAVPPLVGMSLGLTGSPVPAIPPMLYGGIVAATAGLGLASVSLPTRFAMRPGRD